MKEFEQKCWDAHRNRESTSLAVLLEELEAKSKKRRIELQQNAPIRKELKRLKLGCDASCIGNNRQMARRAKRQYAKRVRQFLSKIFCRREE
jgi:hypothetical protein